MGIGEFAEQFDVSRETLDRLILYESLLHKWQPAVNLVSPATLNAVWARHFADSAQVFGLLPENAETLVDLGSGGGFPGLVMAIMAAEQDRLRVTLVESDQRKAAFMREVARQTGIPVDIRAMRIENHETQASIGTAHVVTARALAPLSRLLHLAFPYLAPCSVCVFLKGRDVSRELDEARADWIFDVDIVESLTGHGGQVVVVRRVTAKTEG